MNYRKAARLINFKQFNILCVLNNDDCLMTIKLTLLTHKFSRFLFLVCRLKTRLILYSILMYIRTVCIAILLTQMSLTVLKRKSTS